MTALDHKRCCTVESDSPHVCIWCHEPWPCTAARIRHELAEEIRSSVNDEESPTYGYDTAAIYAAADLIDADPAP